MIKKHKNKLVDFLNNIDFGIPYELNEVDANNHDSMDLGANLSISFPETPFYFKIYSSGENFDLFFTEYIAFAPKFPHRYYPDQYQTIIEDCLDRFKWWNQNHLQEYIEEEKRPDLLKIFASNKNSISTLNFDSNEPFNGEEKKLLQTGLEEIKLLIRDQFDFTNAQIELIDNRIDYLEEASNRIGKTDFKGILISTILSIIMSLSLTPENSEKLLKLFSKIIDNIPQISW